MMREARRVFIVGDSLFAETLAQMLKGNQAVAVVGAAPTVEAALPLVRANVPDAVIVASAGTGEALTGFCALLAALPDLPLIRTDLSADEVQVITTQRVGRRPADLLAAIAALPSRR